MPRSKTPITIVVILLLSVTVVASPVRADQEAAAVAISSAKNTIVNCCSAAAEAEAAGADITSLVDTLNEACSLLSRAELAYTANDFAAALNLATQSQNRLNNFVGEANTLKENGTQQQNQEFLINVVGSTVGAFAVIIAGFAVWRFLKKNYETEAHVK